VANHKLFDWYGFLSKKVLKSEVFNAKNVSLSFWADGASTQGSPFCIYSLVGNGWDCPITVDMRMKVTPKTLLGTKKEANKVVSPRQWQIPLGPGEIVLASAAGYACCDCKPCTVTFEKAKVSKEGKGKCMLKRRGKSMGFSVNPLGLLLLPLGFVVISWRNGVSLELPVKKDKSKTEDRDEDLQEQNLLLKSIWSLEEPGRIDIRPLVVAFGQEETSRFEAEIEGLCRDAYSKWCGKHGQDPDLEVVRSKALTTELLRESEQEDVVTAIPVNANW
jgi:hypothetical protein